MTAAQRNSRPRSKTDSAIAARLYRSCYRPSLKGFDDAVSQGIKHANKTLKNINGAWVKDQQVSVSNGKITEYRVVMNVTFVLKD
ncbi:MAG: dodecin family protein [Candidatus Thiodiazotropha sp. (ex Dulcina madagascariensis)]|nr:dodecin family protein [Candidatus Thiodiazotropha sp. (ex Dulcina madagascariensis)]